MPSEQTKASVINILRELPEFETLNAVSTELFGIDIAQLVCFYIDHGEFATVMLIQSRIKTHHEAHDTLRNAVAELAADKDFMKGMPEELRRTVYAAVGHA